MKRSAWIGAALALSGGAVSTATAQSIGYLENTYVQVNLGLGVAGESDIDIVGPDLRGRIDTDLEAGPFVSALVGNSYTSGLALELEGLYAENDLDTDEVSRALQTDFDVESRIYGGLANVKYEYVNESPLFPYVAAGLGYGETQYRVFRDTGSSDGLLWQLKAGVAVPVSSKVTMDLGYRFLRSPDYETSARVNYQGKLYDAKFKAATGVHTLSTGVRLAF